MSCHSRVIKTLPGRPENSQRDRGSKGVCESKRKRRDYYLLIYSNIQSFCAMDTASGRNQAPLSLPGWSAEYLQPFLHNCPSLRLEERSSSSLWRPWVLTAEDVVRQNRERQSLPSTQPLQRVNPTRSESPSESNKALQLFHHPVRIFWPKSKSYDYLYHDGEKLLQNFPVQATINFYEDSDSEDDDWEEEEEEEAEGLVKEMLVAKNETALCQELSTTSHTLQPFTGLN
uniref:Protein ripply1 n=1 Tax=Geotrypetes seraphini TaxID=260995 RepID=A0A6P8RIQ6_GEOSA|nr:protein ripply1 [Geotrypetes seraphini]